MFHLLCEFSQATLLINKKDTNHQYLYNRRLIRPTSTLNTKIYRTPYLQGQNWAALMILKNTAWMTVGTLNDAENWYSRILSVNSAKRINIWKWTNDIWMKLKKQSCQQGGNVVQRILLLQEKPLTDIFWRGDVASERTLWMNCLSSQGKNIHIQCDV